jgi:hypothetical protein
MENLAGGESFNVPAGFYPAENAAGDETLNSSATIIIPLCLL